MNIVSFIVHLGLILLLTNYILSGVLFSMYYCNILWDIAYVTIVYEMCISV